MSGKPGSSLPIDLGATSRLDAVQNTLTTMAREIADTRGAEIVFKRSGDRLVPDPIVEAAKWLSGQMEWVRHAADGYEPYAIRVLEEIEAAARVLRSVARGPAERVYLGPCGADLSLFTIETGVGNGGTCDGDIYGLPGGEKGRCRTCGAHVDQAERRAWLDEQVAERAYRAAHIADAYRINVKTIRSWADRGRLVQHGHDGDGRPLYLVGDVLDLARQAAAHRAEAEAKRAARQAAEMGG